jgi:hypothetical protein
MVRVAALSTGLLAAASAAGRVFAFRSPLIRCNRPVRFGVGSVRTSSTSGAEDDPEPEPSLPPPPPPDGSAKAIVRKGLAAARYFPLHRSDVVADFLGRSFERPAAREMCEAQSGADSLRDYPLSYVVGPLGSGKTFFALQHLRDFRNDNDLPSVLIYCQPVEWRDEVNFGGDSAPTELVRAVLDRLALRLEDRYGQEWNPKATGKLNLHVCLVLDDAHRHELSGFFERRSKVTRFVRELEAAPFAESVMVVVCGSLVGLEIDTALDAYFFRMRDWSRDDLSSMLSDMFT